MKQRGMKMSVWMAVLFGLIAFFPAAAVFGAPVKIKFSTIFSPTSHFGKEGKWYFDQVEAHSGGRIKMEYYFGGSICKGGEELKALRARTIDAALMALGYAPANAPLTQVFETTYLTTAVDAHQKAIMECYHNYEPLRKQIESTNAVLLFSPPVINNTLWTKFPAPNMAALKGKKIRAYAWTGDILTRFGASPAALVWGDIYNAAKTGIIDGIYGTPLSLGWDAKFYEIAPYVTQTGCGVFGAMALVIRKDLFDGFPKDLQKVILDWGPKGQEQSVDIVMEENKRAVDDLVARGIHLTVWSPEEIAKAKALVQPAQFDKVIEKLEGVGLGKEGRELRDLYLQSLRKFEKTSRYVSEFDYWLQKLGKK
jgi:TRAP-type C4-dicarboxylate transport system substrate-binding protein